MLAARLRQRHLVGLVGVGPAPVEQHSLLDLQTAPGRRREDHPDVVDVDEQEGEVVRALDQRTVEQLDAARAARGW